MSTIVTRTGKGAALTWAEADANFTNLNTDKLEATDRPYSDTNPIMDSTAAQGSSPKVSRQDHVHPSDTTRVAKAGDTMTGQLKGITPVSADDLTRKDYVDTMLPKAGGTMTGALSATSGLIIKDAATGSNDGNVVSGTYTPTISTVVNLTSTSVSGTFAYTRVGNIVNVHGIVIGSVTSNAAATSFYINLPIASNFGGVYDARGTVIVDNTIVTNAASLLSASATDNIVISYNSRSTGISSHYISFSYLVI